MPLRWGTGWVRWCRSARRGWSTGRCRRGAGRRPAGVLLEPVIVPAFRAGVAQAGPAAGFVGGVVLEVGLAGGPAADRPGAGGVPDLGQVPELDPGIVASGLEPVVAVLGGDRVQGDDQVGPVSGGGQPPGAVAAGRAVRPGGGEREPGPVPVPGPAGAGRSWSGAFRVLGFGPGAAVPDGVAVLVGHGHAPGRLRVAGGRVGQVAGQGGVDGADAGDLAGPFGLLEQGGGGDGQGDLPGEPARPRTPSRSRGLARAARP